MHTGQYGHTYSFYSLAPDNAGNVETTPSSAQATTTVDAAPPTSTLDISPLRFGRAGIGAFHLVNFKLRSRTDA
jgi:hypothetical protein